MERETNEFTTTLGRKIVIHSYLTGREVTTTMKSRGTKNDIEISEELIKIALVSIDGVKEDVINKLLDLPLADYLEVAAAVQKIAGENFTKAK